MVVNVKFVGSLRSISGRGNIALRFDDSVPLRKVIRRMIAEVPELKEVLIDREREEPKKNMLILVDGKEISVLNGFDTAIKDGDEVVFVPVTHGG
jgi:molybdopterin converting factor small subunit